MQSRGFEVWNRARDRIDQLLCKQFASACAGSGPFGEPRPRIAGPPESSPGMRECFGAQELAGHLRAAARLRVKKKNKKLGLRDRGWPPKGQARVALACMLLSGDLFTGQMRAWTFKLDSLGTHPLIKIEGKIFC